MNDSAFFKGNALVNPPAIAIAAAVAIAVFCSLLHSFVFGEFGYGLFVSKPQIQPFELEIRERLHGFPMVLQSFHVSFLRLTTLVAGVVLTSYELKTIRRTAYAPVYLLGAFSLLVFWNFGADILVTWTAAWFVGAVIAGIVFTESSIAMKKVVRLTTW